MSGDTELFRAEHPTKHGARMLLAEKSRQLLVDLAFSGRRKKRLTRTLIVSRWRHGRDASADGIVDSGSRCRIGR